MLRAARRAPRRRPALHVCRAQVVVSIAILFALIFSKYFYPASLTSYYTFYLIERFRVSVQARSSTCSSFWARSRRGPSSAARGRPDRPQICDLVLDPRRAAVHAVLPYANLFWTGVLTVIIGLILASAFSAILVYAQELVPGQVGMIAGLFFGLSFGMGGIGAAVLGQLADATSIDFVYKICSFLPAIGLLTFFLPHERPRGH